MRRPDASMSLLSDLQRDAMEPEYRSVSTRSPSRLRFFMVVSLAAVLLTMALLQTTKGAGAAASQRQELLQRVTEARERQDRLADRATKLEDEVRRLGNAAVGDPALLEQLSGAETVSGAVPVTGPGIVIRVDDAPGSPQGKGVILDSDLTRLVNGLWQAGAEAIAINGRRLSTLTPIRAAGGAITVDFVSLTPPYRLEVIGNPQALPARFNRTLAAAWWHSLTMNYNITMTLEPAKGSLSLPADPGMTLRFVKRK